MEDPTCPMCASGVCSAHQPAGLTLVPPFRIGEFPPETPAEPPPITHTYEMDEREPNTWYVYDIETRASTPRIRVRQLLQIVQGDREKAMFCVFAHYAPRARRL